MAVAGEFFDTSRRLSANSLSECRPHNETLLLAQDEQTSVARGLRDGDPAAWTTLYDAFSVEVWRYAARMLGSDTASVADVVQETFLGAARSARHFDPALGTLAGWLFGIAHRQVASHWRQQSRLVRLQQAAEAAAQTRQRLDHADPIAELWDRKELTDLVRSVLAELSADYATLLIAKYLDERSLTDIAEECGDSQDAIKSRLARARREFRAVFERRSRESSPSISDGN